MLLRKAVLLVRFVLLIFSLFAGIAAFSQTLSVERSTAAGTGVDSNFVRTYPELLTGRFYISRKYTNLQLIDDASKQELIYDSNTTLNLGVGITVKTFSLNLAYGFEFLNNNDEKGRTRYLDLQSHVYTDKFIIDFFGQFYKGLYLENTSAYIPVAPNEYYLRGDIYEQIIGLTGFYLFNHHTHSFRSSILQNERQLRSAGTWMAGLEAYYNLIVADSSLIPYFVGDEDFTQAPEASRIATFKFGPSGGYAHTFVIKRHFFIMLNLTLNFGVGRYHLGTLGEASQSEYGFDIGALARFALGYNSDKWYLGLTTIDNSINASGAAGGLRATFGIGNVRLNYAWRFAPGPKLKKLVARL